MNGLVGGPRRAHTGAGRPRRANYNGDFDSVDPSNAVGQAPMTGGVFKSAAFEILKQEERLMTSGEITKLAMERKLLKCTGKTPENTMASALYTEVRKKAHTTVFIKPKEGLFGLKAWLVEPWLLSWLAQEGIEPADLLDPGGGVVAEPASKRLRTSYNGAASRAASGTGYYTAAAAAAHRSSSNGLAPSAAAQRNAASLVAGGAEYGFALQQQQQLSGGGGGGAHRRTVSYDELGVAAGVASGGGGGGGGYRTSVNGGSGQRHVYGAVPAAGGGRGGAAAMAPGSGGASDTVSSLHLLLDAADEIEGGPDDEPPAVLRSMPPGRGSADVGGDAAERQSSFRRHPPPQSQSHPPRAQLSREPSLQTLSARGSLHGHDNDTEEDGGGGGEGEEEDAEQDDAPGALEPPALSRQQQQHPRLRLPRTYQPHMYPLHQKQLHQKQQQRHPQQYHQQQRHWQQQQQQRPQLQSRLHARGATLSAAERDVYSDGEEDEMYGNEDLEAPAPAQLPYSRRWGPGSGGDLLEAQNDDDEEYFYLTRQPPLPYNGRVQRPADRVVARSATVAAAAAAAVAQQADALAAVSRRSGRAREPLPPPLPPPPQQLRRVDSGLDMAEVTTTGAGGGPAYTYHGEGDSGEDEIDTTAALARQQQQRWQHRSRMPAMTTAGSDGGLADATPLPAAMSAGGAPRRGAVHQDSLRPLPPREGSLTGTLRPVPQFPSAVASFAGGEGEPAAAVAAAHRGGGAVAGSSNPSRSRGGCGLPPRGASISSSAGVVKDGGGGARGGGTGTSPASGSGKEQQQQPQLPTTEEVVEQLRAVLASNGALAGFGAALGQLPEGLGGVLAGLGGVDVGLLLSGLAAASDAAPGSRPKAAGVPRSASMAGTATHPGPALEQYSDGRGEVGAAVKTRGSPDPSSAGAEEVPLPYDNHGSPQHAAAAGVGGGGSGPQDCKQGAAVAGAEAAAFELNAGAAPAAQEASSHGTSGGGFRTRAEGGGEERHPLPLPRSTLTTPAGGLSSGAGPASHSPHAGNQATTTMQQQPKHGDAAAVRHNVPQHAPAASTSVAIHDGMNSPDSQPDGGDRTTPEAEDAAQNCNKPLQQPPQQQQQQHPGFLDQCNAAARLGSGAALSQSPPASCTGIGTGPSGVPRDPQSASAEGRLRRPSGLGPWGSHGRPFGQDVDSRPPPASLPPQPLQPAQHPAQHQSQPPQASYPASHPASHPAAHPASQPAPLVAMSVVEQLQQQHLALLPAVEAARPGDVPDPEAINRIRQQVLEVQSRMGPLHPETGRAYVLLARVLEHKGTSWSLSMAERALLRAWTIVGLVSSRRRTSESGSAAAAVAGVAAAAAAEAGADGASELLGQLPDSFHTFQYLLEQIRVKQSYLQLQQQQQLVTLLQTMAAARALGGGGGGSSSGNGTSSSLKAAAGAAGAEAEAAVSGDASPVATGAGNGLLGSSAAAATAMPSGVMSQLVCQLPATAAQQVQLALVQQLLPPKYPAAAAAVQKQQQQQLLSRRADPMAAGAAHAAVEGGGGVSRVSGGGGFGRVGGGGAVATGAAGDAEQQPGSPVQQQ
ncbi:hypothetical protein Agub_g10299 [Astrephomene gubernaculifera]|uniref:HTH HARE-type domain-containing protein n=1 Tax=Astrephomene gubernaculifera TaxID=47775 RepID=A0AAD3DUM1_9CHLO|nr:hypothetical protein Agub_g10299 [Astrephomene gubernaculifera]